MSFLRPVGLRPVKDRTQWWLEEDGEGVSSTLRGLQLPYLKHQTTDRSQYVCQVTIYKAFTGTQLPLSASWEMVILLILE